MEVLTPDRRVDLDLPLLALAGAETPAARLNAWMELLRLGLDPGIDARDTESALLARCDADPVARATMARSLSSVFRETRALGLFAEAGLPNDRGLWEETTDRLARKFLPRPRDDHELARALTNSLPQRADLDALANARAHEIARLVERLEMAGLDARPLSDAASEALLLIATRVAALGLTEAMRARLDEPGVRASAFHQLVLATQALLTARETKLGVPESREAWFARAAEARIACDGVHAHLEQRGISLDLVYAIDAIRASVTRMERLVDVLCATSREGRARAVATLWLELVRAKRSEASLRALLGQNLRLLARKVIERAGRTGEHYIAVTRAEYRAMLASAAGGGLVTTFTAAFKLAIVGIGGPLFVQGILSATNYAVSFVAIQHLGFTLATKQPSMTAAALAGVMGRGARETASRENRSGRAAPDVDRPPRPSDRVVPAPRPPDGALPPESVPAREHDPARPRVMARAELRRTRAYAVEALVTHVARIVRSQLAAAFSNIVFVALGAWTFAVVWAWIRGTPFLDGSSVDHVLESLHPWRSLTVFYAALTGALLWVSSLIGGSIENWIVYRRIPTAIAEHRLGAYLGAERMRRAARFVELHVSGWGVNVSLGFLLGMTPVVGAFFGLPLEVRHVTLSTGMLAFAITELGQGAFFDPRVGPALLGIAVIFVLNLGVSFGLALRVALRARDVETADRRRFLAALARRLVRSPFEFVFPPRDAAAEGPGVK